MEAPSRIEVSSKAVAQLAAEIGVFEEKLTARPRDVAYFGQIQNLELGLFRLVVVGEIKKGKSSFINAFCGIPGLVPVHSDVATSTVFKLRYGHERRYTVYFRPNDEDGNAQPKREIALEAVASFGTEDGNPKNEKGVEFIAVEAPSPILRDGLIVVDTPGVGGLFKEHREITFRHAPRADAVFFVTDSVESPIGSAEVAFLKELRSVTDLVFFVQTKADKADSESCRRRMENNLAILCEQAGFHRQNLRYFVVSSALKSEGDESRNLEDLEESGFPALMQFLQNELVREKDTNIVAITLRRTRTKIESLRQPLAQIKQVLDADSEEKRMQLDTELRGAEEALRQWSAGEGKRLLRDIAEELTTLFTRRRGELDRALRPGGTLSDAAQADLAVLSNRESVYQSAPSIFDNTRAAASKLLLETERAVIEGAGSALEAGLRKAGIKGIAGLRDATANDDDLRLGDNVAKLAARATDTNTFETLRTASAGFGIGASVLMVAGGLIGSVIPVVGTIAGSWLGAVLAGCWGATAAVTTKNEREVEGARRDVQVALDRELGNLHLQASNALQLSIQKLRSAVEDRLEAEVAKYLRDLAGRRQEVQSRRSASVSEIKEKRTAIDGQGRQFASLERRLAEMEKAAGFRRR